MEHEIKYPAIAALIYAELAPVVGLMPPTWEETATATRQAWILAVRRGLLHADSRGLLRLFPEDGGQSVVERL